ncbi:MAG: EAL domain-containing protein [Candidatus Omnitrophica bacterium]|nr:EAL domain-containing protein [Candidatus Omnitrophota bacterium]
MTQNQSVEKQILQCLLIEDVASDAQQIHQMLEDAQIDDLKMKWVSGLSRGINHLKKNCFDVVLLDLNLSDNHGLDNFKKLYSLVNEIPIIVLTSIDDEKLALKAVQEGAQDYIVKDQVDVILLLRSLRHAIARSKTQDRLREAEERYRTVANYAYDWEYWENPDGSMQWVSPSCARITGYTSDQFMNIPFLLHSIIVLEDRKIFSHHRQLVASHPGVRQVQFRIRRKDGCVVWIEHVCQEVTSSDGAFIGVRASNRDITERQLSDEALRQSEEKFRKVIQSANDALIVFDLQSSAITDVNTKAVDLLGMEVDQLIGLTFVDIHPKEEHEKYQKIFSDLTEENFIGEEVFVQNGKNEKIPVEINSSIISLKDKKFVLAIYHDIRERRKSEEKVRKLSLAVEQSPASVLITDTDGVIEYVNSKFCEVTGYSMNEVIGQKPGLLKSDSTTPDQYKSLWSTIKKGNEWRGEFCNKKKSGALFWEFISISPIKEANGTITHFLAVKEDITFRKQYEKKLIHQANFDALTDLPNRILAFDRLTQAINMAQRKNQTVAVMFIDLDYFKVVNDTLGHAVGDELLVKAAHRLQLSIRTSDTVARLGGDEFLIILPDLNAAAQASIVVNRILEDFSVPFILSDKEIFITTSIGITIYPADGDDPHVLLKNADAAMYQAKEASRNTFRFFLPEMNNVALQRMELEHDLRRAIENHELTVYYQPIFTIATGKLMAAEALLRWKHPDKGYISPERFIPLAEETGLIDQIGAWVIKEACHQLVIWIDQVGHPFRMAVNVSARQFKNKSLVSTVTQSLESNDLDSGLLELEVTERLLMEDSPKTTDVINQLKSIGVSFSIDDFGIGYSALSYLNKYDFNTLKIDRSFIRDVTSSDSSNIALCNAIIAMAHSLNLSVIGEGVETKQQLDFLKSKSCDGAQGYYFSKALSVEDFFDFINHYLASFQLNT